MDSQETDDDDDEESLDRESENNEAENIRSNSPKLKLNRRKSIRNQLFPYVDQDTFDKHVDRTILKKEHELKSTVPDYRAYSMVKG